MIFICFSSVRTHVNTHILLPFSRNSVFEISESYHSLYGYKFDEAVWPEITICEVLSEVEVAHNATKTQPYFPIRSTKVQSFAYEEIGPEFWKFISFSYFLFCTAVCTRPWLWCHNSQHFCSYVVPQQW